MGQIQIPVVGESFVPVVAPVAKQRGAVEYRSGSRRNPRRNPLHRIRSRLRDDLRCAVCLRDFCSEGESSSPVTLPCGHSFCRECVGGMRGSGANTRPFRCPLDRAMVSGNLDLRVNATMRDLIRLVGRKLTVEGRTPVKEGGVENGGTTVVEDRDQIFAPGVAGGTAGEASDVRGGVQPDAEVRTIVETRARGHVA